MARNTYTAGAAGAGSCMVMAFIYAVVVGGLTFWTDRNLDFWVSRIQEKDVDVNIFASLLLALFAPFTFLGNVISEVIRMCL